MEHCMMIVRSVTHAQHMVRVLERCGLRARMLRAPAGLTNRGCSYAVRIRSADLGAACVCLRQSKLRPLAVFRFDGKQYQEVSCDLF